MKKLAVLIITFFFLSACSSTSAVLSSPKASVTSVPEPVALPTSQPEAKCMEKYVDEDEMMKQVARAEESIRFFSDSFDNRLLAETIIGTKGGLGVVVEGLIKPQSINRADSNYRFLIDNGINVIIADYDVVNEQMVIIVDRKVLITGPFYDVETDDQFLKIAYSISSCPDDYLELFEKMFHGGKG